jgi:hypothetical protein
MPSLVPTSTGLTHSGDELDDDPVPLRKPLLEEQLRRTGPGYVEYIERTSGFFPLPNRRL